MLQQLRNLFGFHRLRPHDWDGKARNLTLMADDWIIKLVSEFLPFLRDGARGLMQWHGIQSQ